MDFDDLLSKYRDQLGVAQKMQREIVELRRKIRHLKTAIADLKRQLDIAIHDRY